jgi:hypothetical protein
MEFSALRSLRHNCSASEHATFHVLGRYVINTEYFSYVIQVVFLHLMRQQSSHDVMTLPVLPSDFGAAMCFLCQCHLTSLMDFVVSRPVVAEV